MEIDKFVDYIINDKKVDNSSSDDALKVMQIIDNIYQTENISNMKS
jgi:hypothetical protein